jgi:RNA ligase
MPHIHDLIPPQVLADALEGGYVRERFHPSGELRILNYSEKAAYERHWDEATLQCRGLITDMDGNIIARCLRKFFNVGEHDGERMPSLDLDSPVEVTNKMDGSLAILHQHKDEWSIATRGSFVSEQAIWATQHYRAHYSDWEPDSGLTYLFEILYPQNRIVLDYGDTEALVLLAAVDIETGALHSPLGLDWPGPKTEIMQASSLRQALEIEPRVSAEGVVIRYLDGPMKGQMVKVKQDDYVALHRLITGLNERVIWESMVEGTYERLIEKVPDEFHVWCRRVHGALEREYGDIEHITVLKHDEVMASLPEGYTQKEFALAVQQVNAPKWMGVDDRTFQGLIFAHHSGRDMNTSRGYWKFVRPRGDHFMKQISEDVA